MFKYCVHISSLVNRHNTIVCIQPVYFYFTNIFISNFKLICDMALQPYSFEPTINDIDSNFNPVLFVNEFLNTNLCIENRSLKSVND